MSVSWSSSSATRARVFSWSRRVSHSVGTRNGESGWRTVPRSSPLHAERIGPGSERRTWGGGEREGVAAEAQHDGFAGRGGVELQNPAGLPPNDGLDVGAGLVGFETEVRAGEDVVFVHRVETK